MTTGIITGEFLVALPKNTGTVTRGDGTNEIIIDTPHVGDLLWTLGQIKELQITAEERKQLIALGNKIRGRFSGH